MERQKSVHIVNTFTEDCDMVFEGQDLSRRNTATSKKLSKPEHDCSLFSKNLSAT